MSEEQIANAMKAAHEAALRLELARHNLRLIQMGWAGHLSEVLGNLRAALVLTFAAGAAVAPYSPWWPYQKMPPECPKITPPPAPN